MRRAKLGHHHGDEKVVRSESYGRLFLSVPHLLTLLKGYDERIFEGQYRSNVEDWFQAAKDWAHQNRPRICWYLSNVKANWGKALVHRIQGTKLN